VRILLVGFSTRAIAESAAKGGYDVITLDYFGDRDQKELVQNYSLMRDFDPSTSSGQALGFSAKALLVASRGLDFGAFVYISNLENHPDVVEKLAADHTLLGNDPATLRRVRDWGTLREVCRSKGVPIPATLLPGEEGQADVAELKGKRWLTKPVRSGGGHGIAFWSGEPLAEGHLLQEYVDGPPCSAAFVADGRRCVLLGLTEQLIGRRELGARRFTWCGNILPLSLETSPPEPALSNVEGLGGIEGGLEVTAAVQETLQRLTGAFGLRGVNGVDFVLGQDEGGHPVPYLVEVNPRYTASMELVEWAYGINVFDLHIRFFNEELPSFHAPPFAAEGRPRPGFYGKGIVYAREDVVMPDTAGWRDQERRDIPFPGERIAARHPLCTVLAKGGTRDECWHRLLAAAEAVWQEVEKPALDRERRRWCLGSS
jgi:predicted ATP-grasp superfamily ATP-dependent carboligase